MSTVEISILNKVRDLARIPALVAQFAAAHHLSPDVEFGIDVALDEMLSNIIKYGYTDEAIHEINVRLSVSGPTVVVEIEDDGQPFDPRDAPVPDIDAPLEERPLGGLGIHIVRSLMVELDYTRVAGRNRLVMKMLLRSAKEKRANGVA